MKRQFFNPRAPVKVLVPRRTHDSIEAHGRRLLVTMQAAATVPWQHITTHTKGSLTG